MRELEGHLPQIMTPVLILQAKGDPVVDPAGTKQLFEQLGSGQKDYRLFDFTRHGILSGEGADQVYRAIGEFIEMIRGKK